MRRRLVTVLMLLACLCAPAFGQDIARRIPVSVLSPTIYGGTTANADLLLGGTSHATRDTSYVWIQPSGGHVGIGAGAGDLDSRLVVQYGSGILTARASTIHAERFSSQLTGDTEGLYVRSTANPTAASDGRWRGIEVDVLVAPGNTQVLTGNIAATVIRATYQGSAPGSLDDLYGAHYVVGAQQGSGNLDEAYGGFVQCGTLGSYTGTLNKCRAWYIDNTLKAVGSTINEAHALHIAAQTNATLNYAIYSEGGQSYHEGNWGIGTTPGADNPLHIVRTGAIATQIGLLDVSGAVAEWDLRTYRDNANGSLLRGSSARGTRASPGVSQAHDRILALVAEGYSAAAGGFLDAGRFECLIDGAPDTAGDTTDMPGRCSILTTPDGTATALARFTVNNAGDVGIGTTAPAADTPLHLVRTGVATTQFLMHDVSGAVAEIDARTYRDNANGSLLRLSSARGTRASPGVSQADDRVLSIIAEGYSAAAGGFLDAGRFECFIDGTPDSGGDTTDMPGRCSIFVTPDGTATAVASWTVSHNGNLAGRGSLSLSSDNGSTPNVLLTHYNSAAATAVFGVQHARGTLASPAVVQSGDHVGGLNGLGYSAAAGAFRNAALIRFVIDGEPDTAADTTDMPGAMEFYTSPDGSSTLTLQGSLNNAGLWRLDQVVIGTATLTVTDGALGLNKITASASAPGAAGGKLELVCGTNAGTAKLVAYAGTSGTAVTVLDNIGGGVSGC